MNKGRVPISSLFSGNRFFTSDAAYIIIFDKGTDGCFPEDNRGLDFFCASFYQLRGRGLIDEEEYKQMKMRIIWK
jgi:hypothetical protein